MSLTRRMVIVREGVRTVDGRLIKPGATEWDGPIPLWGPTTDGLLLLEPGLRDGDGCIGALVNLRREHDDVVGDLALTDKESVLWGREWAASANGDSTDALYGFTTVTFSHYRLRSAVVIPTDQWAWT